VITTQYISFVRWAFEGLAYNEFTGQEFLVLPVKNATHPVYTSGTTVLASQNLQDARHWKSELILLAMIAGWRILGYLALRFNKT